MMKFISTIFPYIVFIFNLLLSIYIFKYKYYKKIRGREVSLVIASLSLPIIYFIYPHLLFNYGNYVITDMVFKSVISLLCIYIFLEHFIRIKKTRPSKCFSISVAILFIFIISPIYWCHEGWGYHCQFIWSSFHLH